MRTCQKKNTSRQIFLRFAFVFGIISVLFSGIYAQTDQTPQRGFHPAGSYALSDIETINTNNGNLMLRLPLASLPAGRGGSLSASIGLFYNSKNWDSQISIWRDTFFNTYTDHLLRDSPEGGWRYGFEYKPQLEDRLDRYDEYSRPPCGATEFQWRYKLKVSFPDGSMHEFRPRGFSDSLEDGYFIVRPDGWGGGCSGDSPMVSGPMTYYSIDGTYLRLEFAHDGDSDWSNNPWTLYFPDGGRVTGGNAPQRIYDRNNNYLEIQNITYNSSLATRIVDQLDRQIIVQYGGNQDYIHQWGFNGQQLQWTVKWKTISVFKAYYPGEGPLQYLAWTLRVVDQIILPAQAGALSYTFSYNAGTSGGTGNPSYGWGEVSSITLPSGAQASYQYEYDGDDFLGWHEALDNYTTRKDLAYQREYDGSSTPVTETWLYTLHPFFTIIGPDGGFLRETHDLKGKSIRTEKPDGSVIERIWQENIPAGEDIPEFTDVNPFVKTEFTSIRNSSGALVKTAIKDYTYNKNGNVTQVAEYGWVDYGAVPRVGGGLPTGIPTEVATTRARFTTNNYYSPTPVTSDNTTDDPDVYHKSTSPNLRNAIKSSEVAPNIFTVYSLTEFFYDNPLTTGNLVEQKGWDSTKGSFTRPLTPTNSISITHGYDPYGNRTLTTDARGFQTQFIYDPINGHSNLYITQTKVASGTTVQRRTTQSYDFHTGLVTQATDVDNDVTTRTTYDVFGRPTLVEEADGIAGVEKHTATEYSDPERHVIVRSDLDTTGDGKLITIQHYDQLGRTRLTRKLESGNPVEATDETKGVKIQTRYFAGDSNNSYGLVSAPYRAATSGAAGGEAGMAWNRTKSDKGGRVIEVETFAGAAPPAPWGSNSVSSGKVTTGYDAEFTTVTDQAGKKRRSETDAFGRLVKVTEDPGGSLNFETTYLYDSLGNLRKVTQGAQNRWFAYDSLSRLIRVKNPEQDINSSLSPHTDPVSLYSSGWSMAYSYDANGNLTQRIDARGIVANYHYDALNRNWGIDYINGSQENYVRRVYDGAVNGKGRLHYDWTQEGSVNVTHMAIDSYDALGRPLTKRQHFWQGGGWGPAYAVQHAYDLAGNVKTLTYPSGRIVNYSYDQAGRLSVFSGNLGGSPRTYADTIGYNAAGQMIKERFGTNTSLYHNSHYNNRQQLVSTRVGDSATDEWNWSRGAIGFYYGTTAVNTGNIFANDTDNNGNLRRQTNYVPLAGGGYVTPQQDDYTYDALNRINSFTEIQMNSSGQWTPTVASQNFGYDPYGNRRITSAGGEVSNYNPGYDLSTNRIDGLGYDAAGNITSDPNSGETMTYDAENRLRTATKGGGGNYIYNADGNRVRRITAGQETWYVYGCGGELLAEYAANGAPSAPRKEYGYRGGQLLIVAESGSGGGLSFIKPASRSSTDIAGQAGTGLDGAAEGLFEVGEPVAYLEFNEDSGSTTADVSSGNNTGTLIDGVAGTTADEYGNAPSVNDIGGELLAKHPAGAAPNALHKEYRNRKELSIVTAQSVSSVNPTSYQTPFDSGYLSVNSPTTTEHGMTNAWADSYVDWAENKSCKWFAFQPVSGQITRITLKFDWSVNGAVRATTAESWEDSAFASAQFSILYSTNNGSNFTSAILRGESASASGPSGYEDKPFSDSGSFSVDLPANTPINQIIVRDRLYAQASGSGLGVGTATLNARVWSIRLEVERDTTAPVISNVAAGGITATGATITWTTNENSDSQVEYGTTTAYGQSTTLNPAHVTAHSQGLSGLTGGTLYHYRVKSRDAGGNLAVSGDFSFTTPDTTPPVISNVVAGGATATSATITWNTNENSDSQVEYGTTTAYGQSTALDPALVTAHSQGLSGLTPGTLYHYRVKSRDAAGNLAVSGDFTFTTAQNVLSGIKWLVTDHLGSTRMVIDETGSLAGIRRHDFAPFGEELSDGVGIRSESIGYSSDSVRQKFGSKERDNETGLDFFEARYFSSIQGRFTSADPITVTPARMLDPQQLNLYAYVRNNPLSFIDPTGMIIDTSRLNEEELKKYKQVVELANAKDKNGNYVNPKLHEIYNKLATDKRTFFVENRNFGDQSSTIGEFHITKIEGNDFSEAVLLLDFKKTEKLSTTTDADLVPGFKKFEGLLGDDKESKAWRLAELFGHEGGGHGVYAIDNTADAVKYQTLLNDRDAALKAMPKGTRYPYPPDVMQKMEAARQAGIPTERYAQQVEKIINGELRASKQKK
jgi:RHS repeat-associated protein